MAASSIILEQLERDIGGPSPMRRDHWDRFRRNRMAVVGLVVAGALVALALAAPVLTHMGVLPDPYRLDVSHPHQAPNLSHLLGTDALGRDMLSRTIYGARVSLSIGVALQALVLVVGGTIGLTAGYAGGWVDALLMRLTDVMYAFPDLLFVLVIASVMGPGYWNIFLAVGLVSWPFLARLVRAQVLAAKEQEFMQAARASGSGPIKILACHLVPNAIGPVVVTLMFGIPAAIFIEAFLSFVGVGLRPPTPSWGVMVNEGYQAIFAFPREVLVPSVAITLATASFNFIGDGLRDAFDPRSRR